MSIQHFPCNIDADGHLLNLEEYFNPCIRKEIVQLDSDRVEQEVLTAAFRGRPIKGVTVPVPKGMSGFVVMCPDEVSKNGVVEAQLERKFSEFTQWHLSEVPHAKRDPIIRAYDWLDVANALHSTCDVENADI